MMTGAVLFLCTLHFPAPPGGGLDETWQLLLSRALLHGWRMGVEVAFTSGPLGALENRVQLPDLYWAHAGWQVFSRVATTLLLVRLTGRLPGVQGALCLGLTALLFAADRAHNPPDPYLLLGVFAAGLTLLDENGGRWHALALAVLVGFSLLKFTLFVAAGFSAAVAMAAALRRRDPASALWIGSGFGAAYLIAWRLLGQQWGDLAGSLRCSLEVADGYVDAMQLRPGWKTFVVVAALAAFALGLSGMIARGAARLAWPCLTLTAGCLYLAWRHGTVRGDDGHLPGLLCATASWPAYLLARTARGATSSRLPWTVFALAALSTAGLARLGTIGPGGSDVSGILAENLSCLLRPLRAETLWRARADSALQKMTGELAGRAGESGNIAVYASDYAALALLPGLKPLPNLQPYSAYTPGLARRDREAFDRRAPDFVFIDLSTIDDRLAGGEHAPLLARFWRDYDWVEASGRFGVLRRKASAPGPAPAEPAPRRVFDAVRFGQVLALPAQTPDPLQLEADLRPTKLGRIIRFFIPLPPVKLNVRVEGNTAPESYRLTWRLAGEGVLMRPLIRSNPDLETWMKRGESAHVESVAFDAVAARWLYREPFAVKLRPLAGPP